MATAGVESKELKEIVLKQSQLIEKMLTGAYAGFLKGVSRIYINGSAFNWVCPRKTAITHAHMRIVLLHKLGL